MKNKKTFEVELDGKTLKLAVVMPTPRQVQQGQSVYNRAFGEAVSPSDGKPGALVRPKLESVLRQQNLWDDAKEEEYKGLRKRLLDGEKKLEKGGMKLSEARAVAIDMAKARGELRQLTAERNRLDDVTAEAQAEQARFNYYVAECTVYETGKPYFKGLEDFLSREEDPVAEQAPSHLAKLLYGVEDDFEHRLPENKFLLRYRQVDEKLRLIDRDGKWIDEKGRRVDEQGRLINERGELIDAEGNPLTEEGDYKFEFKDFVDDEGNPVLPA